MNAAQRRVLLYFFKGYWKAYALIAAFSAALAAIEALHLALVYPVLNSLLDLPPQELGALGRLSERLIALVPAADPLIGGCVLLILLTPLKGALSVVYEYISAWAAGRVLYRTKRRMLEAYVQAPYQYFLDHKIGELAHYALTSPTRAANVLNRLPQMLVEALRILAVLTLLFSLSPSVTLLLLALGAAAHQTTGWLSRNVSYTLGKGRVEMGALQNSLFHEMITGVKHITVYGAKDWWLTRFDEASRLFNRMFVKDSTLLAASKPAIESIALTGLFGTLLVLKLTSSQSLFSSLPAIGIFCMAMIKILPSLAAVSRGRLEVMGALPDIEGIHRSLLTELRRPKPAGERPFARLKDAIRLEGVHLDYPGRARILNGIDIEIPAGKTTALAGDSGSGKTTVLNLLLGLFAPTEGLVTIDGLPLAEYDPRSWLSRVAVVTQDPFIFHGTISENILFGRPGYSRADMEKAAQRAHAEEFIAALPQGYDTPVGERGMKLSGGQQQRIAIARAILGEPEILLFDEATSALDSVSEAAVQKAIAEASLGRTVVQIAHRLSTIESADRIYVLHEGRVVEQGTHAELLAKGGRYARFRDLQAGRAA